MFASQNGSTKYAEQANFMNVKWNAEGACQVMGFQLRFYYDSPWNMNLFKLVCFVTINCGDLEKRAASRNNARFYSVNVNLADKLIGSQSKLVIKLICRRTRSPIITLHAKSLKASRLFKKKGVNVCIF